ncbi:hypothetical protein AKO1_011553 [Acrasis kona]|uniref:Uncharacterized protein n=1 Tax=Acrasis kona TaxID=1008807 RepID=A0AAW2Z1Q5_9EUKA
MDFGQSKVKHLEVFKVLDKFISEALSEQIQDLCSYLRVQAIRQLSLDTKDENDSDTSPIITKQIIPDSSQQLLIEYTCLPILSLPEDPKPSSHFTLTFLNELESKYLNFDQVKDLLTKTIIPIVLLDFEGKEALRKKIPKLQKLQLFINCYIVSLVNHCQIFVLTKLSEILSIFSPNARRFALKTFYLPTARKSKFENKRKIALKTIEQFSSDIKDSPFLEFDPIELLSTRIEPHFDDRSAVVVIAAQLCKKYITISSRSIDSGSLPVVHHTLSRCSKISNKKYNGVRLSSLFLSSETTFMLEIISKAICLYMMNSTIVLTGTDRRLLDKIALQCVRLSRMFCVTLNDDNLSNALFAHQYMDNHIIPMCNHACKLLENGSYLYGTLVKLVGETLSFISKFTKDYSNHNQTRNLGDEVESPFEKLIQFNIGLSEVAPDVIDNSYLVVITDQDFNAKIEPIMRTCLGWTSKYLSMVKDTSQKSLIRWLFNKSLCCLASICISLYSAIEYTGNNQIVQSIKFKLNAIFYHFLNSTIVLEQGRTVSDELYTSRESRSVIAVLLEKPGFYEILSPHMRHLLLINF